MSSYAKILDNFHLKTLRNEGGIPAIKVNKSGFSVGSYSTSYDKFFVRKVNSSGDSTIDYSLYLLWYYDLFLQTLLVKDSSTYHLLGDFIDTFLKNFSNDDFAEFTKDLLLLTNLPDSDLGDNVSADYKRKLLSAVTFLKANHKYSLVVESNCLFGKVLMLYCKSTESFFRLAKFSLLFLPYFLQCNFNLFDKKTIKFPNFKSGNNQFTNTVGYNISQVIKMAVELSELICKFEDKATDNIGTMPLFNDTRLIETFKAIYKDKFSEEYLTNDFLSKLSKSLELNSLQDDFYGKYIKSGDIDFLFKRCSEKLDFIVNDYTYNLTEYRIETVLHLLHIFNKKLNDTSYELAIMSCYNIDMLNQEIVVQLIGNFFISSGYINDIIVSLDKANSDLDSLNEKYKMIKSMSKQYKKTSDESKQVRYKLESRLKKTESELAKFKKESISKADYDILNERYTSVLDKLKSFEGKVECLTSDLVDKTNECSKLIKENKQYKSQILQIKGYISELRSRSELKAEISDIPLEQKIAYINQFDVLLLGGLDGQYKSLQQSGCTNITWCKDLNDLNRGVAFDAIVVCTSFCSHALLNTAKSNYKTTEFLYFNHFNVSFLVDLIYSYFVKTNSITD